MRGALCLVLASLALSVAACASGAGSGTTTPSPVPVMPTPAANVSPAPSSVPGPGLNPTPDSTAAVEAALNDAATHLGVARDQLRVVQAEPKEWPDSSLGCPQPGQMYSQIVTPGYLIVISAGAKQLEYHTDARSRVILCRESST